MPRDEPTKTLYARVAPDLKDQVNDYAQRRGITLNAAVAVLLDEGLRVVRNREEAKP